eukprot:1403074-Amphidinium_carterae.5
MDRLQLAIASRRVQTLALWSEAWPGKIGLLGHPDEEIRRGAVVVDLKSTAIAMSNLAAMNSELRAPDALHGWDDTPRCLRTLLDEYRDGLCNTRINEEMHKTLREREVSKHLNRRMRSVTKDECMARIEFIPSYGRVAVADELSDRRFDNSHWAKIFDHRVMERAMLDEVGTDGDNMGAAKWQEWHRKLEGVLQPEHSGSAGSRGTYDCTTLGPLYKLRERPS